MHLLSSKPHAFHPNSTPTQVDAEPASEWSAAGWIISQGFIPTELAKALLPDGDGTELDKMRGLAAELGSEDVLEKWPRALEASTQALRPIYATYTDD